MSSLIKLKIFLLRYKWYVAVLLLVGGGGYYYFFVRTTPAVDTASYYVVEQATKGEVSSGILTTGKIVAADKLDLDVYKQLSRIDTVNIGSGGHVNKGDVIVSFDKNDAYVDVQSSHVAAVEAELALEEARANATDPNAEMRTLENTLAADKKTIADTEQDIKDAYQDFLNANMEVAPESDDLKGKAVPTLSGRYVGTTEGEYVLAVYRSAALSGFSFSLSGLERGSYSIYTGKAVDLGTRGLKITFPTTLQPGTWIVRIPNTTIASYVDTRREYENTVADLNQKIATTKVDIANTEQKIDDLTLSDSSAQRDLNVDKALSAVNEARQKLSKNYDVVKERDIVAPFSGTIQGMQNVVVGATPTGGTSDPINLGTLISDDFLADFTLGASDVAKIKVGQKVKVTVTSFPSHPTFEGTVTEISSLPSDEGVAQYTVKAAIKQDPTKTDVVLREGVLADIEVVEQDKDNALRVPTSAITYQDGKPSVKVIDSLTQEQKDRIKNTGILRTDTASLVPYTKTVELGIRGSYYTEIISGLDEGSYIVTTATAPSSSTENVVQQTGFRPGGNGNVQRQRTTTSGGGG